MRVGNAVKVKVALLVPLLVPLFMSTSALAADPIEAKAKVCAACHGESGVPQLKTTPVIWARTQAICSFSCATFSLARARTI